MKGLYVLWVVMLSAGCELIDPNPGPEPAPTATPSGAGGVGTTPVGGLGGVQGGGANGGGGGGAVDPLVADGQALYMRSCAVCHGADAQGAGPYPQSIQGRSGIGPVVLGGRGAMPGFAQLNNDDIAALEAFLAALVDGGVGGGAAGGGGAIDVANLSAGEIYQLQCSACHGDTGDGTDLGPQIRLPVAGYATWVIRNGREGLGYGSPMPAYDAAGLPDAKLTEILTWLGRGPRPTTGAGLYGQLCANCHGGDARGGPVRQSALGEDVFEVVREGEGGRSYGQRTRYMPAWSRASLSDAEVSLIAGYLRSLGGGGWDDD